MDEMGGVEPVYLFKDRTLPSPSRETGATNLLHAHGLKNAYQKYCQKKVKETLSHYLPDLPGIANMPAESGDGLRALIEGPPPITKNIEPLNAAQLDSFRLVAGTTRLPEEATKELLTTARRNKKKKKENKKRDKIDKKGDKERKEKRKKKREKEKEAARV